MQRSTRPKSAKGKVRPTPPSNPRPQGSVSFSRASTNGRINERSSRTITTNSSTVNPTESHAQGDLNASSSKGPDPKQFPEISRPTSSLSKYRILPRIPATPNSKRDYTEYRSASPAESELELDLLSSFAQQMILESAKLNNNQMNLSSTEQQHSSSKMNKKKDVTAVNSKVSVRRQNVDSNDSPVNKKPRSSSTRSIFQQSSRMKTRNGISSGPKKPSKEPAAGTERIKLALKLPDGKRVERYFSITDTIAVVMDFVQTKMRIPIRRCDVFTMLQVPKLCLHNWKKTLLELNIVDRTVLYIEEKD